MLNNETDQKHNNMRHIYVLCAVLASLTLTGPGALAQEGNQTTTTATKGTATVVFATDIHCESCKKKIEGNMPYEKGVKDLLVDIAKKEVSVTYRTDKTDPDKLLAALNKLGYKSFIKSTRPDAEGRGKAD